MTIESPEREAQIQPHWTGRKDKRARTPIANGTKLIMADGRSLWAKRFTEICSAHCRDLGGFENLSQAELAIIKRAATLQVELEAQETRLANGEGKIDLVAFAQVSNGLRRLLETVGIKRIARDISPSIADLVARHKDTPAFVEARAEQERADTLQEEGRGIDEEPVETGADQAPSNTTHASHLPDAEDASSNTKHASYLPDADEAPSNLAHAPNLPDAEVAPSNRKHVSVLPDAEAEPSNVSHVRHLPDAASSNAAYTPHLPDAGPSNTAHDRYLPDEAPDAPDAPDAPERVQSDAPALEQSPIAIAESLACEPQEGAQ